MSQQLPTIDWRYTTGLLGTLQKAIDDFEVEVEGEVKLITMNRKFFQAFAKAMKEVTGSYPAHPFFYNGIPLAVLWDSSLIKQDEALMMLTSEKHVKSFNIGDNTYGNTR